MIKVLSNATSHVYYLVACEILALATLKDSDSILELTREFNVPLFIQNIKHSYFQMALQRIGSKGLPWNGEQMNLWESLIDKAIAFD